MLKLEKEKEIAKLTEEEENSYRKDFWKTAKKVTNGTFGKQMSGPHLTRPLQTSTTKINMKNQVI